MATISYTYIHPGSLKTEIAQYILEQVKSFDTECSLVLQTQGKQQSCADCRRVLQCFSERNLII